MRLALLLLLAGCTPAPKLTYVTNLDQPPTQFDQRKIMQQQQYRLVLELAYAQEWAKFEKAEWGRRMAQTKTNHLK